MHTQPSHQAHAHTHTRTLSSPHWINPPHAIRHTRTHARSACHPGSTRRTQELLASALAAPLAALVVAGSLLLPAPPPAHAVLSSPNARIVRTPEAALRRSIPAANPEVRVWGLGGAACAGQEQSEAGQGAGQGALRGGEGPAQRGRVARDLRARHCAAAPRAHALFTPCSQVKDIQERLESTSYLLRIPQVRRMPPPICVRVCARVFVCDVRAFPTLHAATHPLY